MEQAIDHCPALHGIASTDPTSSTKEGGKGSQSPSTPKFQVSELSFSPVQIRISFLTHITDLQNEECIYANDTAKITRIASSFLQTKMAHMTHPLATAEQLYQRNNLSLLPRDLQDVIFYMTQTLTQAAGVLLQLPQSVTAQANVVLARYWLAESRPLLAVEFSVSAHLCTHALPPH